MTDVFAGRTTSFLRTQRLRSSSLSYNITSVDVNCEFSETYAVTWMVYSPATTDSLDGSLWNNTLDSLWKNSTHLVNNATLAFSRSDQMVVIPCCFVNYGSLFISVRVSMTGHNNVDGFSTERVWSVFVSQTDLVASLQLKDHREYAYNSMVSIWQFLFLFLAYFRPTQQNNGH